MMKQLALTIIVLAACTTANGQQIKQRVNNYRSHEILTKQRVETDIDALLDNKGEWNLEDAKVSGKKYRCSYDLTCDTLTGRERGQRVDYLETLGRIDVAGTENHMERMDYDMTETWLGFPMQVGDTVGGYFCSTGPYCGQMFVRRFGTYRTKADATGCLTLPDGTTLEDVLRLHTERHISTTAAPIDTMSRGIPRFTTDSITAHMKADGTPLREDVYRWYAGGYRYPVIEARTLTVEGERTLAEVFCCAPETQLALPFDAENEAERERIAAEAVAKSRSADDGVTRTGGSTRTGFAYSVSQGGDGRQVSVGYTADQSVRVEALVANTQGYVFKRTEQQCEPGNGRITLDCNGLRRGQYILYINVDGQQSAEKFSLK